MKLVKRLAAMLLAVCLVVPCTWMSVNAADGVIFFTDLEGISVGENFTITGSVVNRDGNLGQVELTMSYDSSAMKYLDGDDNVTDNGDGTLVYSGTISGEKRLDFEMNFEALVQGETRLEQTSAEVTDASGAALNLLDPPGYSDVKIEAGDGTTTSSSTAKASNTKITVNDTEYTVASSFPTNEIPTGFSTADISVNGENVKGAVQDQGSAQLIYLLDAQNEGAFFLYDSEEGAASPVHIVNLASGSTIILLGTRGDITLPARYQEVDLEISETQTLPAWQDSKNSRYYLMNALNANGDKVIYRYDSKDQTYQYYGDDVTTATSGNKSDGSIFGKVATFVQDHVDVVLIGAGFAFLVLLLLILILAVKLHRRNLELDDVYDELDELTKKKGLNGPRKAEQKAQIKENADDLPKIQMPEEQFDDFEQYDSDDFEDYDDSEDDFDEYDEDYEEYDDYEDDYEDESYEEVDDYDSDYDEDNFEEEYEEPKPSKKLKSRKKNKTQNNDDDDFSIDFIDL